VALAVAAELCARALRAQDYDRFLTLSFTPPEKRAALTGIYAFNVERARTRELVSDPVLGQIRLQWWCQSIDRIYAGTPGDLPVARLLAAIARERALDRALFDRLIDARAGDFDQQPPTDMAALERYAEASGATVVSLALQALGGWDANSARAGRALGTAWALLGLMRALPFHARQRRLYLPADLMREAGLRAADLFAGRDAPGLAKVVSVVADRAALLLAEARALAPGVAPAARPALLCAPLAELYLDRFRKAGFEPGHRLLEPAPLVKLWRLWRWPDRGRASDRDRPARGG